MASTGKATSHSIEGPAAEAICGALAGSANVVSGYPFDTVKVRMQSSPPHQFHSSMHCFQHILKTEGVCNGLFRGVTSPLVGGMLETGVNYMVYCRALSYLTQPKSLSKHLAGAQSPASFGGGAGGAHDSLHATAQAQPTPGGDANAVDRASEQSTPCGDADSIHGAHPPTVPSSTGPGAPQVPMIAVAGAVAGLALSFVLGPVELLKCRMQGPEGASFKGPLHCLRMGLHAEGPRFLARGFLATCAREVPGNAIFFSTYEALRYAFSSASPTPTPLPHPHPKSSDPARSLDSTGSMRASSSSSSSSTSSNDESGSLSGIQEHNLNGNSSNAAAAEEVREGNGSSVGRSNSEAAGVAGQEESMSAGGCVSGSSQSINSGSISSSDVSNSSHSTGNSPSSSSPSSSGAPGIPSALSAILSGGLSGMVMWSLVLPIDVAKTRLQTANPGSSWDVGVVAHLRMLWRQGGIRTLYSGLTPTLVRAFPANAAQWLVWEAVTSYLQSKSASPDSIIGS